MSQYWLDLFTPETWEEARENNFKLSGFRENRWTLVQKIKPGDFLVCYIARESRFSGILKVISEPYKDYEKASKIWKSNSFPCVMDVEPAITLDILHSIPVDQVIPKLTIFSKWGGIVRGSPNRLNEKDGDIIKGLLEDSVKNKKKYLLKEKINKKRKSEDHNVEILGSNIIDADNKIFINKNMENLKSPKDMLNNALVRRDDSEEFDKERRMRKSDYDRDIEILNSDPQRDKKLASCMGGKRKETKAKTTISIKKSLGKAFEDRVWILFDSLGASFLNKYGSRLFLGNNKTKQIDVIAKIDDIVFVVECKASEKKSRSLRKDLAETSKLRRQISELLRSVWPDARTIFIYALDKIELSESDKLDAQNYGIKIWDFGIISYFEDLEGRLGDAAKYQVFAESLGDEEIGSYSPKIPAIKSDFNGITFYYFLARPESLLKIAYIFHRKLRIGEQHENPYQRMVNKQRIKDIRNFVAAKGYFSNNVIANFKQSPKFTTTDIVEGIEYGVLTLPSFYQSLWIIDGQHRLFGYSNTSEAKDHLIPILAFQGLNEEKQGNLFIQINGNQKSVDQNLLWDLYSDIYYQSTDPEEKLLYTISKIGKKLNSDKKSPFLNYIYIPSMNESGPGVNIKLTTFGVRLLKGNFLRGQKDLFNKNYENTIDFAVSRIIEYFNILKDFNTTDWNKGDGGFLRSNIGVHTFLLVFQEILKYFRSFDSNPVYSESEFTKQIYKLLNAIKPKIERLTDEEISNFKNGSSERWFSENTKKICGWIKEGVPGFSTEILNGAEDEQESGAIVNPNQIIDEIEEKVREKIHSVLLDKVGINYWKQVIPEDIKAAVDKKIKDEIFKYPMKSESDYVNGEKKIQFCEINDYSKIIINGKNWKFFEEIFKSKESVDIRFKNLNDFRKRIKHSRKDGQIDEIVSKDGQAAIMWLSQVLSIDAENVK
jgi:DGQHR domain-containing protein